METTDINITDKVKASADKASEVNDVNDRSIDCLKERVRLEKNRIKARGTRKRKKCMLEEMRKEIHTLTRNNALIQRQNNELYLAFVSAINKE
mmetsp:Transcript_7639/g.13774  ORF Transcript_7639/g.13774 Transcript_7639/m.13774 type:complete len:93 (+) Transcript_7639:84-362(+)|eukprot:CAMPEP_0198282706 /NCGR_PEP_ID=MMETSP1449-20131203/2483_1 /TAXON_ID=420275 /ORGANISM="Attheya septentrionalis, Strain CCMP2084" /LENGTH=92 /DNA_ID=CAMNT_0043979077 /DNA_START=60 /DNA_END=338 /DNA_ORIENTATION=+